MSSGFTQRSRVVDFVKMIKLELTVDEERISNRELGRWWAGPSQSPAGCCWPTEGLVYEKRVRGRKEKPQESV
jgi:hypothetical protein